MAATLAEPEDWTGLDWTALPPSSFIKQLAFEINSAQLFARKLDSVKVLPLEIKFVMAYSHMQITLLYSQ